MPGRHHSASRILTRKLKCPRCKSANLTLPGAQGSQRTIETPDGAELVLIRMRCSSCGHDRVVAFAGIVDARTAALVEAAGF